MSTIAPFSKLRRFKTSNVMDHDCLEADTTNVIKDGGIVLLEASAVSISAMMGTALLHQVLINDNPKPGERGVVIFAGPYFGEKKHALDQGESGVAFVKAYLDKLGYDLAFYSPDMEERITMSADHFGLFIDRLSTMYDRCHLFVNRGPLVGYHALWPYVLKHHAPANGATVVAIDPDTVFDVSNTLRKLSDLTMQVNPQAYGMRVKLMRSELTTGRFYEISQSPLDYLFIPKTIVQDLEHTLRSEHPHLYE